ncbi:hypothetical protein ACFL51_01580 [Myxococcota bacterium]
MLKLREVRCRWPACGRWFYLCRACDRGHRYCSDLCRALGTEARKRKARRKYEKTKKGRRSNRKRQKRYRKGQREALERLRRMSNSARAKKTTSGVTDRSSQTVLEALEWGHGHEKVPYPAQILVARSRQATVESQASKVARAPSGPSRRGTFACCHRCGRRGRVVRQRRSRGRFRYAEPRAGRQRE